MDAHGGPPPTEADSPSIFVSYWHPDRPIARDLESAFEGHGLTVHGDWDLPPGAPYPEVISGWIEVADAFVFLLTPEYLSSPECEKELTQARALGKRLAPVL